MTLIKDAPFQAQRTEEERAAAESETIKLRLNTEERAMLDLIKIQLAQPKDGTCLKQCLEIAHAVVGIEGQTRTVLGIILGNRRRADRLGIPVKEDTF